MNVKAILFDAGGIIYHRPRKRVQFNQFLGAQGIEPLPASHPKLVQLKQKSHLGQISEHEYYQSILDIYRIQDPNKRAKGSQMLSDDIRDFEFFEGVTDTLLTLKQNGFFLGIVTNTFNRTTEKLEWFKRIGIDQVWDSFATSCELGVIKPDPQIYLAALDPLGVPPEKTAFVGHAQRELDGAKALGMKTIAFNRDDPSVTADVISDQFSGLLPLLGL